MSVDRKQLIIEAASKSFSLFGYKGTTMEQVAKIANVGKGTIYTFFANKEQLFQEVMNRLLLDMKVVADAALQSDRQFFDNLTEVLNQILIFKAEYELAIKLTHEVKEIGTPMAQEALQQIEKTIIDYIALNIEVAVKKGEIKQCDPTLTAFVFFKLYVALAVEWEQGHKSFSKDEVANQLRFYLEKGIATV